MSNTSGESPIVSNEHYEFLQLNQVGRLSDRASKVVDAEEQSLRQFNAELLHKIGEYRKKNLEISANENELKTKLAHSLKSASEREREIVSKYENEIAHLRKDLEESRLKNQESHEDLTRRLSKLSDESWAQGLENENLKRIEDDLSSKLEKFQEELTRAYAMEESNRSAIETLMAEKQRVVSELGECERRATDIKEAFDRHTVETQTSFDKQNIQLAQMVTAYEALRLEYANMDRCYMESNQALVKIQTEMRERYQQHETELEELTTYLTNKAAQDSALIREENAKLRESLSQRDTRLDQDRQAMETWKEQLTYHDTHLKQFSDKIKKAKSEMIRLSKSVEEEVKFSVSHPFTDYLDMADLEMAEIAKQLGGISSMSPLKAKLETRLQQATAHRDGIKAILEKSATQASEHAKSIQTLIKSFEYLT
jgi:chromosome segregation ATPase